MCKADFVPLLKVSTKSSIDTYNEYYSGYLEEDVLIREKRHT